jgi:uncharacterized membrane protein
MLCGYGISSLFEHPPERRNTLLVRAGLAIVGAFLLLRGLDLYGDPNHWQRQPGGAVATTIDFLDTTKYSPSLQFVLMTLGPAAILCGLADRLAGSLKHVLVTYGRVPFAFYVAHFYVIHALSVMLGLAQVSRRTICGRLANLKARRRQSFPSLARSKSLRDRVQNVSKTGGEGSGIE